MYFFWAGCGALASEAGVKMASNKANIFGCCLGAKTIAARISMLGTVQSGYTTCTEAHNVKTCTTRLVEVPNDFLASAPGAVCKQSTAR